VLDSAGSDLHFPLIAYYSVLLADLGVTFFFFSGFKLRL
jgi:hypothetical protein